MRRSNTASDSDESPLTSSLTTPVEEEPQPFDDVLIRKALGVSSSEEEQQFASLTPRASNYEFDSKFVYESSMTPKASRSLSKGFMKAKQFAKSIGKGSLRGSAKVCSASLSSAVQKS
jgi:hypothetical protein